MPEEEDAFRRELKRSGTSVSKGDLLIGLVIFGPVVLFLFASMTRRDTLLCWSVVASGVGFFGLGVLLLARGIGWKEGRAPGILGLMGARRRVHPGMLLAVGAVLIGLGGYLFTLR
jgi:hypothetical protein